MVKVIGIILGLPAMLVVLAFTGIHMLSSSSVPDVSISAVDFAGTVSAGDILDDPVAKRILNAGIFYGVETELSHAAENHPGDQELYNKCLNGDGTPVLAMFNPDTEHCVEVIETEVEEGGRTIKKYLVRVIKQMDGIFQELTAFTDDWATIDHVENYLVNGGYMQIPLP